MDIQNKDNLNKCVLAAFALFFYCAIANAAMPEQILLNSYKKNYSKTNSQDCAKIISELQSALNKCKDSYLSSRIKYRIGVLNFNLNDYNNAFQMFNYVEETAVKYDILVSALNMKANCARFSGQPEEAIVCFQKLIKKIEKQKGNSEFESKLIISSYFSIAQLYSQIGDSANSIKTYTAFIEKYDGKEVMQGFIFKAIEAKARKLFESGKIKRYQDFLKVVLQCDIPRDHKGLLELQLVCIEFILKNDKIKGLSSVAMIPAYALSVVANNCYCNSQDLVNQIEKLNKKYEKTKSSIYIKYTYAWLLDLSGNKQEAIKIFKDVIDACANTDNNGHSHFLGEYAKIQSSILLGELRDYNLAMKMVNSLGQASSGHLSVISQAVKKSLATLKREVPKNEKIK